MPNQFQRHKKVMAGARLSGVIASVADDSGAEFTDTAHGLQVNDIITISGCSAAAYNGRKTVTAVDDANTFKTGDAFVDDDTGTWEANYIIEVFPYATYSSDTRSAAIDMGPFDDAVLFIYKTAGTLANVFIDQSPDGGTTWHRTAAAAGNGAAVAIATGVGNETCAIPVAGPLASTIAVYLDITTSAACSVSIELCRRGS